jgi:integrase
MPDPIPTPSFSTLLQRFFVEHLGRQRAVSPRTIAAYRDTFRLLLSFAEAKISKSPAALALVDLDARLILSFLDHLEKERNNGARSRNARLAALRSFLRYAAHHDFAALHVIEQVLAIPMKRFDRPVLGFLSRQEMQAILDAPDPRTWARLLMGRPPKTASYFERIVYARLEAQLCAASAIGLDPTDPLIIGVCKRKGSLAERLRNEAELVHTCGIAFGGTHDDADLLEKAAEQIEAGIA